MREQLLEIKEKRSRLHKALEENKTSIDVIIEAMYYDSETHFVWELLQNADDAGATEIALKADSNKGIITLEHNGRPFTIADIDGISNIGASTKKHISKSTGKFGVGFKSVFSFCESVEIYNGEIAIELTNRLNFEILNNIYGIPSEKTLFIFKGVSEATKLVDKVFRQLDGRQDAFMYLKNIEKISLCNKTFKANDVLSSFYSIQTENLTFSFKEGIKGNFYCLFPLKCETELPIHINGAFDVTASRDDFRGNSRHNEMLLNEYETNFVRILHTAKNNISIPTMMEIILKADKKFNLKKEKLIQVDGEFYTWNELVQDRSAEKIYEKFPFFFKNTTIKRCADIDGLMPIYESDIEKFLSNLKLNLNDSYREDYLSFIQFVYKSDEKRKYLIYRIFVADDGEIRHGDHCEYFKFDESFFLHLKHRKKLHFMFDDEELYSNLHELDVNNDFRVYKAYSKICETKELLEEDIENLNLKEKDILRNILIKEPLFKGLCAKDVWVSNTLLYILNPDKNFVMRSKLTDFLNIVSSIDSLAHSTNQLSEQKVRGILSCGDSHRMLIMLDFMKDNLGMLPFFKNPFNNLMDPLKVESFFKSLFIEAKIVFDIYGNHLKLGDTSIRNIDPAFFEAYNHICKSLDVSKYLGKLIDMDDSIWGYGDGELETSYTRGMDPRVIGELGEKFAYDFFKKEYPDKNVQHLNGVFETGEHYDILIDNKIKVEVKTRKSHFSHAKREVKLSDLQVQECIKTPEDNFWLAIVNLDMQKLIVIEKSKMLNMALRGLSLGPHIFYNQLINRTGD